ncbi:MAG: SIMPL domain-containing protein [Thiomonas arsenitoxydans]|nr:SIMPL domain-containing protein [Thiomonas arsenitoxydans]
MKCSTKFIAACALFISATACFSQKNPALLPVQQITLSATASVPVPQDVLTLSLTTQREALDAQSVQTQLKAALEQALAQAKRSNLGPALEVHTGHFHVSPRTDRNGKVSGWAGSAELVLQGRDFARLGELAGQLTTLTVANASFALTEPQRQAAQSQAQSQAIALFLQRAQEAAKSFGYASFSLLEASLNANDFGGGRPPLMAMSTRAAAAEAPLPLEAGVTTVSVTVSGSVQLTH